MSDPGYAGFEPTEASRRLVRDMGETLRTERGQRIAQYARAIEAEARADLARAIEERVDALLAILDGRSLTGFDREAHAFANTLHAIVREEADDARLDNRERADGHRQDPAEPGGNPEPSRPAPQRLDEEMLARALRKALGERGTKRDPFRRKQAAAILAAIDREEAERE